MNIDFVVKTPEGIPYTVKAPLGTSPAAVADKVRSFHNSIKTADPQWDVIQDIETHGNPNAVSPKGAEGDMQTMPKTLTQPGYGVAPAKDDSPAEKHRVGVDYWNKMKETFHHPLSAAMAYNWGPGNVQDWLAGKGKFEGHQKDWSVVPKETKDYINNVIGHVTRKSGQPQHEDMVDRGAGDVGPVGKDMLTDKQKDMIPRTKALFDPDPTKGAESPLSKLGALYANQDTFKTFNSSLNAVGITFPHDWKDNPKAGDRDIIQDITKQMGIKSTSDLPGHIAIGPQGMSGQVTDVIHHELIHFALDKLRQSGANVGLNVGDAEEKVVRAIMIKNGWNVKVNKEFLSDGASNPERELKFWSNRAEEAEALAKAKLKNWGKK